MAQQKPIKFVGGVLEQSSPSGDDVTFLSVAAGAGGLTTAGLFATSGNGTFQFGSTGPVTAPGNPTFHFGTGQSTFGGNLAQSGGVVALNPNGASSFITSAGALTLTSAASALWSVGVGTLTIQASEATNGILNLRSFGTGTSAINISSEGGTSLVSRNGTTIDNSDAGTVDINNSVGAINIGNDADAQPINIGTGASDRTLSIGNGTGATALNLESGTGGVNVTTPRATFSEHVTVGGNLTVLGTTVSTDSETVLVADNHLYLNAGYTNGSPVTGGLVINYDPSATFDAVAAGGFTAGEAGVSNPTLATVGAATFAASDLIQISSAADPANNGLYEVLSHAANVLTVRGVGVTATVEDVTQNQFVTDTTVAGVIYKIAVAVFRAGTDGVFEVAQGSATPLVYSDLVTAASTTLQAAYKGDVDGGGATITTDVTDGDVIIGGTQKLYVTATGGLKVGNGGSEVPTYLAATTFDVLATGDISFRTATILNLGTVSTPTINIGTAGLTQTLNIGTGAGAHTLNIGSTNTSSQLTLQTGTGTLLVNAGGPLTLQQGVNPGGNGWQRQETGSAGRPGVAQAGPTAGGTGGTWTVIGGSGGNGAANGTAGQTAAAGSGAPLSITAGPGGNGASSGAENTPGVSGGVLTLSGGNGGAGTATVGNGGGGGLALVGGGTGAVNGGPGGALAGNITIGNTSTNSINIATSGNHSVSIGHSANANLLTLASGTGGVSITSANNTSTAINISATAGSTNIELRDNAAGVFTLKEGANNYMTVDTTDGNELVKVNQFFSRKMAGISLVSGEALNINDVVTVDTTVGGGRVIQSDANGAGFRPAVLGVVQNVAGGAGTTVRVVTAPGSIVGMNFDSAPAAADQGKAVYLHTVAGQVSLTATAVPGETVFRVGILQNATGTQVLFFPQFVKVN